MSVPSSDSAPRNGSGEEAPPGFNGGAPLPAEAPASSPRPTLRAAETRHPAEFSRMEMLLAERAREAQQLRRELARLGGLLRDATVDFERIMAAAEPHEKIELARQRDAAVARALDAEAGRAEALFRLDELMGHLAERSPHPGPPSEPESGRAVDPENERLEGSVRALEAELSASRAECQRMRAAHQATLGEIGQLREHAQSMQAQIDGSSRQHAQTEGMAEALRETRRLLGDLARAVQRVARGAGRRDSNFDTTGDADQA